jgi:hypothetical protein
MNCGQKRRDLKSKLFDLDAANLKKALVVRALSKLYGIDIIWYYIHIESQS